MTEDEMELAERCHTDSCDHVSAVDGIDYPLLMESLHALADMWDAEAGPLLAVRGMHENTQGWQLQECAHRLRAWLPKAEARA